MTTVTVAGRTVRLRADQVVGQGGEATIYRLDSQTALKLYRSPTDPSFGSDAAARQAASTRLAEQQHKLPAFPRSLPNEVIAPVELVTTTRGIVGFTMPYMDNMEVLMQYGSRAWRESSGIDSNQMVSVFRELHRVVRELHRAQVVIGDFNDLNILTDGCTVRVIDADSMQFDRFLCQTFTSRFLDPLLAVSDQLVLARPHTEQSDWYAYFVMLIQSLLYVGPYGGVHRPKSGKRLQHDDRVLKRLTFLDSDVLYPKPALAYDTLPDDLQAYFEAVTRRDQRGEFPVKLLDTLRFTTCRSCGRMHGRPVCSCCQSPGAVRQKLTIRGQVKALRIFQTSGKIVRAAVQNGHLRYLYEARGALWREGDQRLIDATLGSEIQFRLRGADTLAAHGRVLLTMTADSAVSRQTIDCYQDKLPVFDTTADSSFWLQGGQLRQSAQLGSVRLGDVVTNQTLFWVGDKLGFGLYQVGQLVRGFVFRPGKGGLNDHVTLGAFRGQLVDAVCFLSDTMAWFFTAMKEDGHLKHRLQVINANGRVTAEASATAGEDTWLGQGIYGHLATGSSLFAATDDGVVRVGVSNGQVNVEREFPDTEPFVQADVSLLPGPSGLYVVTAHDITHLTIT